MDAQTGESKALADRPRDEPGADPLLAAVRDSARQWHTLQLGVLGFVGLCGVLKSDAGGDLPSWLQTTAGVLALLALVVGGLAVLLVATVAWPLGLPSLGADPDATQAAVRRLRLGLALTFVAVALTSLSAGTSWWPRAEPGACQMRVATASGVVCGSIER